MPEHPHYSRRTFLKGLAATSLGAGALGTFPSYGSEVPAPAVVSGRARNVILMVSDGMNHGTLSAANHWLNLRENRESEWMKLYQSGVASRRLVETSCADSMVTDSAAASTAWGIGQRVNLGAINVTPDGATPEPLGVLAKRKGKAVGMVSTARITHATPAGFAANVPNRYMENEIAEQYLDRRVDVLLGGGNAQFDPAHRKDGRDLYAAYRNQGYTVVNTREDLIGLQNGIRSPLLGVFAEDHLPYCIDRENQREFRSVPCLETMTRVALGRLSTNSDGFLLQVEAGRVDHAAHANDPATLIREQLEFDRTLRLVRDFAQKRGDTLVIVTSDHGTGGFMLCGANDGNHLSKGRFEQLFACVGSHEQLLRGIDDIHESERVIASIESNYAIKLSDVERERIRASLAGPVVEGLYHAVRNLSEALNPVWFDRFSVSWNCMNHTADLVELAMFGPGSNGLPMYSENRQLHGHLRDCMGI